MMASDTSSSSSSSSGNVLVSNNQNNVRFTNFVYTDAPLLSGQSLKACVDVDDETCVGGVAAVAAYSRYYNNIDEDNNTNEGISAKTIVLPNFDHSSSIVQMHPLGWGINRLILGKLMGWEIFVARPWLISSTTSTAAATTTGEMSGLRTHDWEFLLSNANVPPTNLWHSYIKSIHFDSDTNLAIITIWDNPDDSIYFSSQKETAKSLLTYIADINMQNGCIENTSFYDRYIVNNINNNITTTTSSNNEKQCWIPIIIYRQQDSPNSDMLFNDFLEGVVTHQNNPPALIIDVEGRALPEIMDSTPTRIGKNIWIVSFKANKRTFYQTRLQYNDNRTGFTAVKFITKDLSQPLPTKVKDTTYVNHIASLRMYADETLRNDPIVGSSTYIPAIKNDGLVLCEAGECGIGNLFTDAIRWYTESDFSYSNSGAYHGLGWETGPVRVSNLWEAFPFANNVCTGVMSGISIYRMFNYSISTATFSYADTAAGGNLLQVSGIRITYNTQLPIMPTTETISNNTKLVNLEIWNATQNQYIPVERLKMYKFASDSYNCAANRPFNLLSSSALTIPGEVPGQIGSKIFQEVVSDYLTFIDDMYDASVQGRLINDTSALIPLSNFIQTELSCPDNTYWVELQQTCFNCPNMSQVTFNVNVLDFEGVSGSTTLTDSASVSLENNEYFPIRMNLRSIPPFLRYNGNDSIRFQPIDIKPSSSVNLDFIASTALLEAGTATGEVSVGISTGSSTLFPGCIGPDINFNVNVNVLPADQLNQLGNMRNVGWSLGSIAMMTCLLLGTWCMRNKQHQVVLTMQPIFLVMICCGVFIMSSAILPMSIDDSLVSPESCSTACMAVPWLITLGFTMTFSALSIKLWRINQLFHSPSFRRVTVTEKDVLPPFAILFGLNSALLLAWSIHDPLEWKRFAVEGQSWNTRGVCRSNTKSGFVYFIIIFVLDICVFILACWQAYRARQLQENFSETKNIAMAMFCSFQISIVGVPVLFLLDSSDQSTRYFVSIGLLFAINMSLILCIFFPLWVQWKQAIKRASLSSPAPNRMQIAGGTVQVSGLNNMGVLQSTGSHVIPHYLMESAVDSISRLDAGHHTTNDSHAVASEVCNGEISRAQPEV